MVNVKCVSVLAVVAILLITVATIPAAEAVTCSPTELSSCAAAMTSSSPPSSLCCSKLKEQKPCLCGYLKNPTLRGYVSSSNAKKLATSCKIAMPNC